MMRFVCFALMLIVRRLLEIKFSAKLHHAVTLMDRKTMMRSRIGEIKMEKRHRGVREEKKRKKTHPLSFYFLSTFFDCNKRFHMHLCKSYYKKNDWLNTER